MKQNQNKTRGNNNKNASQGKRGNRVINKVVDSAVGTATSTLVSTGVKQALRHLVPVVKAALNDQEWYTAYGPVTPAANTSRPMAANLNLGITNQATAGATAPMSDIHVAWIGLTESEAFNLAANDLIGAMREFNKTNTPYSQSDVIRFLRNSVNLTALVLQVKRDIEMWNKVYLDSPEWRKLVATTGATYSAGLNGAKQLSYLPDSSVTSEESIGAKWADTIAALDVITRTAQTALVVPPRLRKFMTFYFGHYFMLQNDGFNDTAARLLVDNIEYFYADGTSRTIATADVTLEDINAMLMDHLNGSAILIADLRRMAHGDTKAKIGRFVDIMDDNIFKMYEQPGASVLVYSEEFNQALTNAYTERTPEFNDFMRFDYLAGASHPLSAFVLTGAIQEEASNGARGITVLSQDAKFINDPELLWSPLVRSATLDTSGHIDGDVAIFTITSNMVEKVSMGAYNDSVSISVDENNVQSVSQDMVTTEPYSLTLRGLGRNSNNWQQVMVAITRKGKDIMIFIPIYATYETADDMANVYTAGNFGYLIRYHSDTGKYTFVYAHLTKVGSNYDGKPYYSSNTYAKGGYTMIDTGAPITAGVSYPFLTYAQPQVDDAALELASSYAVIQPFNTFEADLETYAPFTCKFEWSNFTGTSWTFYLKAKSNDYYSMPIQSETTLPLCIGRTGAIGSTTWSWRVEYNTNGPIGSVLDIVGADIALQDHDPKSTALVTMETLNTGLAAFASTILPYRIPMDVTQQLSLSYRVDAYSDLENLTRTAVRGVLVKDHYIPFWYNTRDLSPVLYRMVSSLLTW